MSNVVGDADWEPPTSSGQCRGCRGRHRCHAGPCRCKAESKCTPWQAEAGGSTGWVCGARPPCPCGWRDCSCGQAVVVTVLLPPEATTVPDREVVMVPCERVAPACALDGRLAVRQLSDGWLACRELAEGEQPGPGEWRAREHDDERPGHRVTYTRKEPRPRPGLSEEMADAG